MKPSRVYLDFNATAPLLPEAREAMLAAGGVTGNPSSVHSEGRRAKRILEDARDAVAKAVGGRSEDVIFTSSGSEANQLAIRGVNRASLMVSTTEHDSIMTEAHGATVIPVSADGLIDMAALDRLLGDAEGPALVAVMLANNETGVIQPIRAIADCVHGHGGLLLCDAVQALGKLEIDLEALDADMVSLSAHKLGGPQGVGALVLRPGIDIASVISGSQERRRRGGTENLIGIAGFGAAARNVPVALEKVVEIEERRLRLEARILEHATAEADGSRQASIAGAGSERLCNTSCIVMPGVESEVQVMAFDLAGFAVSAGAACSSGKVGRSHVLDAMGYAHDMAGAAIRVSMGPDTTDGDMEAFLAEWLRQYTRARARAA